VTLTFFDLADDHDEILVIPASDAGVGAEDARFHIQRQGDRIEVITDSDRAWSVWIDGMTHECPPGTPGIRLGR
jgi:hypothetical protein